ncbi:MAG: sigma-70 family RNA polymerase sigma factor [Verrucomicrobiota bacterium]
MTQTRNPIRVETGNSVFAHIVDLTRGLAVHDEAAFREFHARYFDRLYRFLLVVSRGQEHEAQEALQETMLRVARHARAFHDEDAFWCWLKSVARNTARDGGRKQRRYFALLERFSLRHDVVELQTQDGAESRLQTLLAESLNELAPDERALLEGKYLDGTAVRELSVNSGLTEKAVESRLLRLRHQLRERLLKKLNEL